MAELQDVINKLTNEGVLIRNKGANSIKSVKEIILKNQESPAEKKQSAEDARNAIAEANEHAAIAVPPPPLLSEFEWQSGQQPPPLEPPPLSTDDGDGDGDDPNDPMATIRRLANQYRSKHHHRHVAARHDAALHN